MVHYEPCCQYWCFLSNNQITLHKIISERKVDRFSFICLKFCCQVNIGPLKYRLWDVIGEICDLCACSSDWLAWPGYGSIIWNNPDIRPHASGWNSLRQGRFSITISAILISPYDFSNAYFPWSNTKPRRGMYAFIALMLRVPSLINYGKSHMKLFQQ